MAGNFLQMWKAGFCGAALALDDGVYLDKGSAGGNLFAALRHALSESFWSKSMPH